MLKPKCIAVCNIENGSVIQWYSCTFDELNFAKFTYAHVGQSIEMLSIQICQQ